MTEWRTKIFHHSAGNIKSIYITYKPLLLSQNLERINIVIHVLRIRSSNPPKSSSIIAFDLESSTRWLVDLSREATAREDTSSNLSTAA